LFLRCQNNNNNNNNNNKSCNYYYYYWKEEKNHLYCRRNKEGNCWAGIPEVEKTPNHNQPVFFFFFWQQILSFKNQKLGKFWNFCGL
jgi:hypothetical protein